MSLIFYSASDSAIVSYSQLVSKDSSLSSKIYFQNKQTRCTVNARPHLIGHTATRQHINFDYFCSSVWFVCFLKVFTFSVCFFSQFLWYGFPPFLIENVDNINTERLFVFRPMVFQSSFIFLTFCPLFKEMSCFINIYFMIFYKIYFG